MRRGAEKGQKERLEKGKRQGGGEHDPVASLGIALHVGREVDELRLCSGLLQLTLQISQLREDSRETGGGLVQNVDTAMQLHIRKRGDSDMRKPICCFANKRFHC